MVGGQLILTRVAISMIFFGIIKCHINGAQKLFNPLNGPINTMINFSSSLIFSHSYDEQIHNWGFPFQHKYSQWNPMAWRSKKIHRNSGEVHQHLMSCAAKALWHLGRSAMVVGEFFIYKKETIGTWHQIKCSSIALPSSLRRNAMRFIFYIFFSSK